MVKKSLWLLVMFCLVFCLYGGGQAKEPVEISWIVHETPTLTATIYKTIIDRFEAANPGIKVKKELYIGADRDTFNKVLYSTGQMPDILLDAKSLAIIPGALMDLPRSLTYLLEDEALATYAGKIRTMPIDKQLRGNMFYNKAVFAKYGLKPPKTWDEFVTICKTLKDQGVVPIIAAGPDTGYMTGLMLHNPMLTIDLYSISKKWAEDLKSGKLKFTSPEVREIALRWRALIDAGYYHKGSYSFTYAQACDEFLKGSAAMICNGIWFAAQCDTTKTEFEVGWFPLPSKKGVKYYPVGYGSPLGISGKSKHPREAMRFVKFLFTDTEAYRSFIQADGALCTTKKTASYPMGRTLQEMMNTVKGLTPVRHFMDLQGDLQWPAPILPMVRKSSQDIFVGANVEKELENWEKTYREALAAEQAQK